MSNRRFIPRLRRRLRIALAGAPGSGHAPADADPATATQPAFTQPAFTQDVSPGGLALELPRVPRPGTTVHGTLPLGGEEYPFTGVVVWAKAGEPRLQVRGRVGVRFTGIANAFFEAYQRAARP
jgi:hypothetical protein